MRAAGGVSASKHLQRALTRAAELHTSADDSAMLFPGFMRHSGLSENALLANPRSRQSISVGQMAHSFVRRSRPGHMKPTKPNRDVVEACLAHVKKGVRGSSIAASYLSRRRELVQACCARDGGYRRRNRQMTYRSRRRWIARPTAYVSRNS